MSKVCAECRHFDLDHMNDKYIAKCEGKWECPLVIADDVQAETCRDFGERRYDVYKARKAIEDAQEYRRKNSGYSSPGCYLTTAVVEILKKKDDCTLLEVLRFLRGYYLQGNAQYKEILMQYDVVGPVLAEALRNDYDRVSIALDLLEILEKIRMLVACEEIEEAIVRYKEMTESLMRRYGVGYVIGEKAKDNYDQRNGGHGSFVMKRIS